MINRIVHAQWNLPGTTNRLPVFVGGQIPVVIYIIMWFMWNRVPFGTPRERDALNGSESEKTGRNEADGGELSASSGWQGPPPPSYQARSFLIDKRDRRNAVSAAHPAI
jgi:hypothetical protein